ncbi:hypothetical protein ABZ916_28145 [Streptomyces sp. NPDC046853]|uniref:hypothetical protein n=1 Tax=Streptomyces sp. NPDC046853 TaxID=3154920 RepID=UPI0033E66F40
MSRAASSRIAWLRAALILLALLGTVLAPASPASPAEAAPAPPPAAVSTEPAGEAHQDATDSALRVPTRRPAPHTTPAVRRPRTARRSLPRPTRSRTHLPAPRSVVLRC